MSYPARRPHDELRLDSPVLPREVLIVGGGIGGIEALMALADLGDSRLRLHLVAAQPSFVLRPQIVGEPWGGAPLHIDLERLCRAFGAGFTQGTVTAVDQEAHCVRTAGGATLGYERLLLAPGARAALPYPGTRVLGFGALPRSLAGAGGGSVAIVVPLGTTWTLPAYELALLTAGEQGRAVRVVTAEGAPMEVFGPGAQGVVGSLLDRHRVCVETRRELEPGEEPAGLADTVVSLPLLNGPAIAGVAVDRRGFVRVDERMAVIGADDIYAVGDGADHAVKQGGLAGQQADVAATEIVRSCGGDPPRMTYERILRGKLVAADGGELYLRRALDGSDPGRVSTTPLWKPPSVVCAWRLARWLSYARGELEEYTLDHVARAPSVTA